MNSSRNVVTVNWTKFLLKRGEASQGSEELLSGTDPP